LLLGVIILLVVALSRVRDKREADSFRNKAADLEEQRQALVEKVRSQRKRKAVLADGKDESDKKTSLRSGTSRLL
jgi:hypothetical protein